MRDCVYARFPRHAGDAFGPKISRVLTSHFCAILFCMCSFAFGARYIPSTCIQACTNFHSTCQVLNRTNPAFMEIRERVSLYKSAKKHGGQTTEHIRDKKENVDLACECDSYFCSCRKQCFCQLKAEPFDGRTVLCFDAGFIS